MRILFDNGVPRPVASALQAHIVEEARARGWDSLANGEVLMATEAARFEVMVTTDRNLAYQQNLSGLRIALVVLTTPAWPSIRPRLSAIASAVDEATPGTCIEVDVPILRR